METTLYTQKGVEARKISVPESIFGLPWNADLVHQVVTSMESSRRSPVAHTKTRGEVSGGGKKPWKQKGTGRARHGSIRSPLWVGGGVTHGPRNDKDFERKVNKKMKAKALYTLLSAKFKDGKILFLQDMEMRTLKTKDARESLQAMAKIEGFKDLISKKSNSALIALAGKNSYAEKGLRNFNNLKIDEIRNLNPLDVLKYKYVIISEPEKGLPQIANKI